ncbi:MAG: 50S ribosomal protein L3 [Myxococcales bacterium]|nr:50S ribosomal protein L3 [Myxococcales bacterium]
MALTLLGKKMGMTRIFDENGKNVPVTVIQVGPCVVTQIKTDIASEDGGSTDGYNAVQIAFEEMPERTATKPRLGHFAKAGTKPHRHLREFRVESADAAGGYELGQTLDISLLEEFEYVDVQGVSKGKGFAGTFKRWNFTGAKEASHGSHEKFRHGGAIGMSAYPGRVMKAKKMAGHHGNYTKTSIALKVAGIDAEEGVLLVKGSVAGPTGGVVSIAKSKRR